MIFHLLYCSALPKSHIDEGQGVNLTRLLIFLWSFCLSNVLWQWVHRLEKVSKFGGFLQVLAPVPVCHLDYYPNPCNSLFYTATLFFLGRKSFAAHYVIEHLEVYWGATIPIWSLPSGVSVVPRHSHSGLGPHSPIHSQCLLDPSFAQRAMQVRLHFWRHLCSLIPGNGAPYHFPPFLVAL